ncbi:hypothetical protein ACF0H5_018512 [Mactra antiquata]
MLLDLSLFTDGIRVISPDKIILVGAPRLNLPSAKENYTGGVYKCNALSPRTDDCELLLKNEYSEYIYINTNK